MSENVEKGYQYLENDFFRLCKDRETGAMPMLLYLYLRGLYCRFGPNFSWKDKKTIEHLQISQDLLWRARKILKQRGLILFTPGRGSRPTTYTMIGSVLLPEIKQKNGRNPLFSSARVSAISGYSIRKNRISSPHKTDTLYKSNERDINKDTNSSIPKDWKEETLKRVLGEEVAIK